MTFLQHPNREVHREVINYSSIPPKAFARYFANYFILKHQYQKNSFERGVKLRLKFKICYLQSILPW